ncbi:MAG: DUF2935 domain-containing protein [Firmicutes bacterium]|nr:DUF2935 domain-containing protein [Bacillota bacterium]
MDNNDLLFWTYILAEHAMFQANAFSYKEEKYIAEAEKFHNTFSIYNQAISANRSIDLHALENDTVSFISFKKKIIADLLQHSVLINFSPSFINHMVNEADEFLSILRFGTCPAKTENPTLYIKTWLADASGHASTLSAFLDLVETPTIRRAQSFENIFDNLGKKASEMSMIGENTQVNLNVELLKEEVTETLNDFIQFCITTGQLLDKKQIMAAGALSSEITNHFVNEHHYFLHKIQTCV